MTWYSIGSARSPGRKSSRGGPILGLSTIVVRARPSSDWYFACCRAPQVRLVYRGMSLTPACAGGKRMISYSGADIGVDGQVQTVSFFRFSYDSRHQFRGVRGSFP